MRPLLLAAALLAALPAHAFVRTETERGVPLAWFDLPVPFSLNSAGSRAAGAAATLAACRASFATWSAPECTGLRFSDRGATADFDVGFNEQGSNTNLLVWRERFCAAGEDPNEANCWEVTPEVGEDTIALTTVSFSTATGEIVDADIEFNGAKFVYTAFSDRPPCSDPNSIPSPPNCIAFDVQNTATHEIGHFIGLDHTNLRATTMFPTASLGETGKRTLAPDDIDGVCAVYPVGGTPPVRPGDGDDESGCGCASGGAAVAPLLLAACLMLGLRRRAKTMTGAGRR